MEETNAIGQPMERIGGYTIEATRLPKGWKRIDEEGMVKQVREGLAEADTIFKTNLNKLPLFNCDSTIIRWLLGRNLDVQEVIDGLVAKNAYWEEKDLHTKYQQWADTVKDPQTELPHIDDMCNLFAAYPLIGYAKDGSPVSMARVGFKCSKLAEMEKEGALEFIDDYMLHLNVYRDRMLCDMSERDNHIYANYMVYDLTGIGMSHVWNKGLVKRLLARIASDAKTYYVENVKKVYVVNAGYVFKGLYAFVSLFFNKRMRAKASVSTGAVHSEMKDVFDEDILPSDMGGTNERWEKTDS